MLLQNHLPYPDLTRKSNEPTEIEIPAIPKQQEWMPPPYWKDLLMVKEARFEAACKKWFTRFIVVSMILYVTIITSIFLWKLLLMVIALK